MHGQRFAKSFSNSVRYIRPRICSNQDKVSYLFLFQSPALLLEPKNTTFLLTYTVCHNSFHEQYFKDIFSLLIFIMILSFWVSGTSQEMSCAFFSYFFKKKKNNPGRIFPPQLGFGCGNRWLQCGNEQCEIVGAAMAARSIEMPMCGERLHGLFQNVSPQRSIASSKKLAKVKTGKHLLSLSRILLAWPALTFHTRNWKPGTTCTFLLESDTTKRIAKIWRTFLWTSGNFMLGLNRKQVHFTKCQISFWLAHQALSPGCNNYFLLRDEGKD